MKIVYENENGERIPTDCRIENGMIIVSAKFKDFNPKDGDVVVSGSFVFIYNDWMTAEAYYYVGMNLTSHKTLFPDGGHFGYVNQLRPATEEEKKQLFDKIESEGYEWLADEKKLVKKKWKPSMYDPYYIPFYESCEFIPIRTNWGGTNKDNIRYNKGLCFKTKEECQKFCDKLNEVINSIKP